MSERYYDLTKKVVAAIDALEEHDDVLDTRRIKACLNACAGIETEVLEAGEMAGHTARLLADTQAAEARAEEAERLLKKALSGHRHMPMYNGRPSCPWCHNFVDEEETHVESCLVHDIRAFLDRYAGD